MPTGEFTAFQVMFDSVLTSEKRYAGPSSVIIFTVRNTLGDRCGRQTLPRRMPAVSLVACLPAAPLGPEFV